MKYHAMHALEAQLAAVSGQPLPEIELSNELAGLIQQVEERFQVEVLPAPHTFRTGALGSTNSEEATIALFVHPDYPQEESMRTLFHESGHRLQIEENEFRSYDRSTIDGYFECELDADECGWQLAEKWGHGHLHDAEYREEHRKRHNEALEAAWALVPIVGSANAFLITALLKVLVAGKERNLSASLAKRFEWEPERGVGYAELARVLWEEPEAFVGFDRSLLRGRWRLTQYHGAPEPLLVARDVQALEFLVALLTGVKSEWRYDRKDPSFSICQRALADEPIPTNVMWTEGDSGGLSAFVELLQTILISNQQRALALTWNIYEVGEGLVYEADVQWVKERAAAGQTSAQGMESPSNWRIFCSFLAPARHNKGYENALRCYINAFQQVCGVYHHDVSALMSKFTWLWRQSVGPAFGE